MNIHYYISRLNKSLTATVIVSVLIITGIVTGTNPQLSLQTGELVFSNAVLAQSFSDNDLRNYARAVLEIEAIRQPAISQIESIVGRGKAAKLACHQPNTINRLPDNARNIALNYCNTSAQIVSKYGLTNEKFNQITRAVQRDANLRQKVQGFMR
jgi:hypothetical protein